MKKAMIGLGAFLYLFSVVDVVPDVVPIAGWLDDVCVLGWAAEAVFGKPKSKRIEEADDAIDVA